MTSPAEDQPDPKGRTCIRDCRCGSTKTTVIENLLLCYVCDSPVLKQAAESLPKPPA